MKLLTSDELTERERWMVSQGDGQYLAAARAPDGGLCVVARFMYTVAILSELNDYGYEGRWCYPDATAATVGLLQWEGKDGTEPAGWHRHPATGRRVSEDGREYVAL